MNTIAIIDDREDVRVTLVRRIELTLRRLDKKATWSVLGIAPLANKEEYPRWIASNDVVVLILDERLQESAPEGETSVTYKGHEVVDVVRPIMKTLPVWVITAFPSDEDLRRRFPDVEDIIERHRFHSSALGFVQRFVRSGTKFYEENKKQFERLAELARKIAIGEATDAEVEEAKGLQMSAAQPLEPLIDQSKWVTELEHVVADFSLLEKKIKEHLGMN